jgi:hypothetical protein
MAVFSACFPERNIMNQQRRKAINEILSNLEAQSELLAELLAEEQEAYDNMPEGLQMSEKGEAMEGGIQVLEGVHSTLESIIGDLQGEF